MKDCMTGRKHGDFEGLGENYSKYRPGYSGMVLDAVLGLLPGATADGKRLAAADVGAGTGIWSRMLASRGLEVRAVEPCADMRRHGMNDSAGKGIAWSEGKAEDTGLPAGAFQLVSMASAFHWPDFGLALREFDRLLAPGGVFLALWNPRIIEGNPLLEEIEAELARLVPDMKRVSSGKSRFCDDLAIRLEATNLFEDVLYLEARHVERMTPQRYIGVWRSVNDVRVQAGEERFEAFMQYVESRVEGLEHIEAAYLTRAWAARKRA